MPNLPAASGDDKIKWAGTHADFLIFVEIYELMDVFRIGERKSTADEIAKVFLNVIDIDLSPFPDFRSMRIAISANIDPAESIGKMIDLLDSEKQLTEILDGTGVQPSREEQFKQLMDWTLANDFTAKLSKYITFAKE